MLHSTFNNTLKMFILLFFVCVVCCGAAPLPIRTYTILSPSSRRPPNIARTYNIYDAVEDEEDPPLIFAVPKTITTRFLSGARTNNNCDTLSGVMLSVCTTPSPGYVWEVGFQTQMRTETIYSDATNTYYLPVPAASCTTPRVYLTHVLQALFTANKVQGMVRMPGGGCGMITTSGAVTACPSQDDGGQVICAFPNTNFMGNIRITIAPAVTSSYMIPGNANITWLGEDIANSLLAPEDRPFFTIRIVGDTWKNNTESLVRALVTSDAPKSAFDRNFRFCVNQIVATTVVVLSDDNKTARVFMGYDERYSPDSDEHIWFAELWAATNGEVEPVPPVNRTVITITAPFLPSATAKVMVKALTVITATMALFNPRALIMTQGLTMMGSMACLRPAIRILTREAEWTLYPGRIFGYHQDVIFLVIISYAVCGVHLLVVIMMAKVRNVAFSDSQASFFHPYLSLVVVTLCVPGITSASFSLIQSGSPGLALVGYAAVPVPLFAYAVFWLATSSPHIKWITHDFDLIPGLMRKAIYPCGVWFPTHIVRRYGILFHDYTPSAVFYFPFFLLHMVVMAIATTYTPVSGGACRTQIGFVAFHVSIPALFYLIRRPHRSLLTSILRGAIFVMMDFVLLLCSVSGNTTGFVTILTIFLYCCFAVESVFGLVGTHWEVKNIFPKHEEEEEEIARNNRKMEAATHEREMTLLNKSAATRFEATAEQMRDGGEGCEGPKKKGEVTTHTKTVVKTRGL